MRIPVLLSWLFFMPICLLSISFYVPMVCGKCLSNQKFLLLQLKNSLIFDNALSTKLVHWNKSIDCCSWEGVTCNKGRVIGLDLTNDSISCRLDNSSSLFKLEYLQNLNLAYNNFSSSEIPSEINKLSNLVYLNLSNTGFEGQIPITISHLKGLVSLDLRAQLMTYGYFMLMLENPNLNMLVQNLSKLTELYLDGVDISMHGYEWGPTLSFSLPNLRVLSLSSCNLLGPFDPSLANLESLSVIDISNNRLCAPIPDFFADFKNLTTLDFSDNLLNGKFPERIFQIPSLKKVDLSKNQELEGFFPDFPLNGSLQTLLLSVTKFSGSLPYSIGNLKLLSELDLSYCNFSGEIPKSMANLTELFHLELSMNRFNGSIPSLSMSKNLRRIILQDNDLTGQITSTQWVDLLNLEALDLSYNSLEGSIPVSLFSLPSLQELSLQNNRFSGQLDEFSTAPSYLLSRLDLSHNNLEGKIPMSLFKIPSLVELDLSSNNLNGSWQFSMTQKLKHLTSLDLSYNDLSIEFSGINFSLFSFPKFSTLRLASNKLKIFPYFLRNQSALNNLDLSNCQIDGQLPHWIWEFTTLTRLNLSNNYLMTLERPFLNDSFMEVVDLSSNKLQGQLPRFLLRSAKYLDLSRNNFHSSIPTSMGNIVFLFLSSNKFYGSIPESICNATHLCALDLSNNFLSGMVPHCLPKMSRTRRFGDDVTKLGVLNLTQNNLSGKIPDTFQSNCGLQTLDLAENQLEGKLPKSLSKCKYLEFLDIENNNIEDAFPCYLRNISTLRVLVLRSNKFHGPIDCMESINATWPMLQIINLASNNFSGKLTEKSFGVLKAFMADKDEAELELIHQEFTMYYPWYHFDYQDKLKIIAKGVSLNLVKILTVFTILDLSCNNFDGPLPKEIGKFKSLYVLNLSHNGFTGNIPQSWGELSNLESLDLSSNKLTGEIPVQLADGLIFLSVLNLSFNQLSGKIPEIKQFATFPISSYKGNIGLCGLPLEEHCTGDGPGFSTPTSEESDSNSGIGIDWNFLSVELGFIFGFAIAVGPLMFWKRWRMCYYKHADDIFFKIFPRLYITIENRRRQSHMNHRRRAHRNQGRSHE
ncbi:hypothetical protein F2P56_018686 [Juglans regia]|uniref:Receptor-like protein 7 n=2 Tax=Juglans regia TaxID=51240 RepID=A0A2I4FDD7_JUGRE|nr:receptor-like protein 7 [Juglans regia]XP_018829661.1 receptor-like protein 7 [Juglans regia]KAF5462700.1 hypothetical protein F2P56_018686 [Juglans regia]